MQGLLYPTRNMLKTKENVLLCTTKCKFNRTKKNILVSTAKIELLGKKWLGLSTCLLFLKAPHVSCVISIAIKVARTYLARSAIL